jgi:hypothetical protein
MAEQGVPPVTGDESRAEDTRALVGPAASNANPMAPHQVAPTRVPPAGRLFRLCRVG